MTSLSSLIHRKPVILPENATIQEAARAIAENQIGCVLVCNSKGNASGILTDRDLAIHWASPAASGQDPLAMAMSQELILADENAGLLEIIQLMETHGVRRIPLIQTSQSKHFRFIGIVTLDDLIAADLIAPARLANVVRRQISRRIFKEPRVAPTGRKNEARGEAHQLQTFHRYLKHIADSTGLSEETGAQVSNTILASLVMRINMTGATHFLAQLPERVRAPLTGLPAGPDKFITPHTITAELVDRFHFTEAYARSILHRFLSAIFAWMSPGQIDHLLSQLPEVFHPYFEPAAEAAATEPLSVAQMILTCPTFIDGTEIPKTYTADGFDRSPKLEWSKVPPRTREFALICEDPDVSRETPWVHWVLYGVSGAITQIPEGIPQIDHIIAPLRARQGRNSSGKIGYQGPMPHTKEGWHRYFFRLYALAHEISLAPGASADELRQAMKGHILAEGVLVGRYRRAERKAA